MMNIEEKKQMQSKLKIFFLMHKILNHNRTNKMRVHVYSFPLVFMPGGYSLKWPIRGGSAQKGYLFQASGI